MTGPFRPTGDMTVGEILNLQELHCRHRGQCLLKAKDWPAMICMYGSTTCDKIDPLTMEEIRDEVEPLLVLAGTVMEKGWMD